MHHVKIKATEARPSHDCAANLQSAERIPLIVCLKGFLTAHSQKHRFCSTFFHLLFYHQPGYVLLIVIWEYLLTGRCSDSRRELMRNKSGLSGRHQERVVVIKKSKYE